MDLLGIDVGTSGCKATVVDVNGSVRAQAYAEYTTISLAVGYVELEPDLVFSAVCEVASKALSQIPNREVKAICVSSFGEAAVPIDVSGKALHNAMVYIDVRGQDEAQLVKDRIGMERALAITGASIHPMYTLYKIMWLKKNKPDVYRNTYKFLLFADYVLFRLGARPHTDYSLATRTMAFDIVKKEWSHEMLECAGVDIEKFAEPVQAGTIVGNLSAFIAAQWGLSKGTTLVSGGHDQPCAALGAGAIVNGVAVDGLGTTECVTPSFDKPVISKVMAQSSFACVPHVCKDKYVTYAFTFTSGGLLKWYRNFFGQMYAQEAARTGKNIYTVMIESAAKEPSDLYLLPHFAGAATPYMDTAAKGMIAGLTLETQPKDIVKAILEGITFEMMINLEKLDEAGIPIRELRAVGGLAQSDTFLQLKADMMGRRIASLHVSEAGTLGVAMLAGTAIGVYHSLEEAVERLVQTKRVFEPDARRMQIYREKFAIYKNLYPASKMIDNR